MKKITILLMLLAGLFAFNSCNEKAATVDVPVSSLQIDLDDIVVGEELDDADAAVQMLRAKVQDALNSFSMKQTFSQSSIDGLEDVLKYQSEIKSVLVGSASISIAIVTDGEGTVVKEFLLKTSGIGATSFSVAEYELGTDYAAADLLTFAEKLLLQLLLNKNVTITASGKTDVPNGENLKVRIILEDVIVTVNVLNDSE